MTNCNVWSPDSQWIVYDARSDPEGSVFDGVDINMVNVENGEVRRLYHAERGAHCGVATFDPTRDRAAFILGPENPTPDWRYSPAHRHGVIVECDRPDVAINIDARDLAPPFTPGALRGGSHVHVFSPDGEWISFTYNDALLSRFAEAVGGHDIDQRNIGVSVPIGPVIVEKDHPRNLDGAYFTVLATRTVSRPRPGSDEIAQALEEGWIGSAGYLRLDGTRQRRALAFQGQVTGIDGEPFWEIFIVDLPEDVTKPSPDGPLAGTITRRPTPPLGTIQRRLTRTEYRKYPGICAPRHWLRTSPDGAWIAYLMRDDDGMAQLWTISPNGGSPAQITRDPWSVASTFTWNPHGGEIAYVADNSVFTVNAATGASRRVTARSSDQDAPSALACVYSPDSRQIAFQRRLPVQPGADSARSNQICVVRAVD